MNCSMALRLLRKARASVTLSGPLTVGWMAMPQRLACATLASSAARAHGIPVAASPGTEKGQPAAEAGSALCGRTWWPAATKSSVRKPAPPQYSMVCGSSRYLSAVLGQTQPLTDRLAGEVAAERGGVGWGEGGACGATAAAATRSTRSRRAAMAARVQLG